MRKVVLLLLAVLLLAGLGPVPVSFAAQSRPDRPLKDLWIDIAMGPPLVEWFNQTARPDDIARVDVWELGRLDQITAGRKLVVFKSVAEAEELMPRLADRIDIIGYNLEHGPANPQEDQADPVGSVRRMRELADRYGKTLAMGPDRRFALSDGIAIAPYVDVFVLQVQRVQTDPEAVRSFTLPLIEQLRRQNPNLSVTVQVRTEGDVDSIVDLLDSLKDEIDGVSILTSPETVDVAKALVAELRTRQPEEGGTRGAAGVEAGEPAAVASYGAAGTEPVASESPDQNAGAPGLTPLATALVGGIIGGGLVAAVLCRRR